MYIVDEENSVKHSANGEQEVKIKTKPPKKRRHIVCTLLLTQEFLGVINLSLHTKREES